MANESVSQESIRATAVAIDKDKNSQYAVKWAVENSNFNRNIVLVHVNTYQGSSTQDNIPREGRQPTKDEQQMFFLPYRGFCARRGVRVKEIVIHDMDVANALAQYIIDNSITTVVLGSSSRNAITRAFKTSPDIIGSLTKSVPDFCTVYIVSKSKAITAKSASRSPTSGNKNRVKRPSLDFNQQESKTPATSPGPASVSTSISTCACASVSASASCSSFEGYSNYKLSSNKGPDTMNLINGYNLVPSPSLSPSPPLISPAPSNVDQQVQPVSVDSFSGSSEGSGPGSFRSSEWSFEHMDHSQISDVSKTSSSTSYQIGGELEDEMRRLKLELKQTMDMYNNACKETTVAKERVKEIHQMRYLEAQKLEESNNAQDAAFALVMMEKQKCRAALEAAEMAQRLADLESKKRKLAEKRFQQEVEEKKKAMDALARFDIGYRKYSIEEIETATNYFASSEKIGEGGYGPVYKACLDHTPVAIKVLRPDLSQGQKQFRREVEVLCRMRHPNMVLLLGACPEYGCLVYEYMDRGSLEDRLFCRNGSPPLPWGIRFRIAAEIATTLLFLHQTKPEPLVHRDLKPANILLDKNYVSKIGDVGLSRLVPSPMADSVTQYHMTSAAGTFCYIDPEYQQTGMLGTKSDIYSFGIVLLQIITARHAMGLAHQIGDAIEGGNFAEILDPKVPDWPIEDTLSFAKLALQCCELRRKDRPDLGSVVLPELQRLRDLGLELEPRAGGMTDNIYPAQSFQDSLSFSQERSSSISET